MKEQVAGKLPTRIVGNEELQDPILDQFVRVASLDLAFWVNTYETQIMEIEISPWEVDRLRFVYSLITKTLLSSYLDICQEGSPETVERASYYLAISRGIKNGQLRREDWSNGKLPIRDVSQFLAELHQKDLESYFYQPRR